MQCYHKACDDYLQFKIKSQWFLSKPDGCEDYWWECAKTYCAEHL